MISPRVAIASGTAGAFLVALMVAGRLDGSVVLAVVLAIAARAAAVGASTEPAAARALGRLGALVPAWIGIAVVAVLRAGSTGLADVRGANAVAGLSLARGDAFMVAACWVALLAGMLALVAPTAGGRALGGLLVSGEPQHRLEAFAIVLQGALLVTLFAGPQIRGVRDIGPWIVGALGAAEALWFGRRIARWDWVVRAASVLAAMGVVLAIAAGRP